MQAQELAPAEAHALPWWLRAHQALMPDYNRRSAFYWWALVGGGAAALAWAVLDVARMPGAVLLQVSAGCLIAMLAGLFPIRIPGSKNTFAAGEVFIFLLLMMHGPGAAALAAAGEAFVGTLRSSRRWTSRLASPAVAAAAMVVVGSAFHTVLQALRASGHYGPAQLLLTGMVFALGCFLFATTLIAALPYLKRKQRPTLHELFGNFGWVAVTYAFSSLAAGLLYLTFENVGIDALVGAVPIIAMMLTMLHLHFRQREVAEAQQALRVEAAEREASQAARHVEELSLSQQRFQSAFSNAAIGMALVSTDCHVLQVNQALCKLLGRAEDQIVGHPFEQFVHAQGPMQELLHRPGEPDSSGVELLCRHPHQTEVWVSLHAATFSEPNSNAPCLILQAQDITARRHAEARLEHFAFHDSLTSLVNRARFGECVAQAIEQHRADARRRFAVMYLDFDRFKLINDSLGHSAGDLFLVTVARRIQQQVRPGDLIARLGGDEFAILVNDLDDEHQALAMAARLQESLQLPFSLNGTEINSSASIGITFGSIGYASADDALRDADIAMYRAKADGRARHVVFDAKLRAEITDKVQLEADLRLAIEKDQIDLAYQPIYDLGTGKIVSFEALARWQHPQRGPVGPDRFIAIAEESGLIGALTERMLAKACRQIKAWHGIDGVTPTLGIQVNLSGIDLCHERLAMQVASTLLAHGLSASHLTLEITESTLMTQLDRALENLVRLRGIGVGLSVDDFGTGYSSLSYLTTLPITSLKIDRSFVGRLSTTAEDNEVVKAIVGLGAALGKKVVAEGIETADQLLRLRELGCHYGQGFLLSRPLTAAMAESLLSADRTAASPPIYATPVMWASSGLH